jgi:hypothetical protein
MEDAGETKDSCCSGTSKFEKGSTIGRDAHGKNGISAFNYGA